MGIALSPLALVSPARLSHAGRLRFFSFELLLPPLDNSERFHFLDVSGCCCCCDAAEAALDEKAASSTSASSAVGAVVAERTSETNDGAPFTPAIISNNLLKHASAFRVNMCGHIYLKSDEF